MNPSHPPAEFDLTGHFGGFVRTEAGKRRLVLHAGEQDCLLKVPRLLRRDIIGRFRVGETIRAVGRAEPDSATGLPCRIASQIVAATPTVSGTNPSPSAPAPCPVWVCANKNCWRKGGRGVWQALSQEIAASETVGKIELHRVQCLDRCNQAPNVDWGDHAYTRCSPADASAILAQVRAALAPAAACLAMAWLGTGCTLRATTDFGPQSPSATRSLSAGPEGLPGSVSGVSGPNGSSFGLRDPASGAGDKP